MTTSEMTPADIRACTSGNGDDGFGFGGNGAWWIIILFLFAFASGGWGGFGGGGGAQQNYVLASDFATIQRQLSDGFSGVEKGIDTIRNGLCDGFYTEAQLINGVNTNILQTGYGIQNGISGLGAQMAQCCCDIRESIAGVNYNMATQANALSREVERGFCDAGYRDAMNTNALMQSGHTDADRIIAKLDAMEVARKDETIARQNQELFQWQLRTSQADQTAQLLRELGYQCPKPAYVVQPPQQVSFPTNCCGQASYAGGGCGCGNF